MSFTKLYSTILDSSVWTESESTRIVWIAMLAMATKAGIVHASRKGLMRRANVSSEALDQALAVLEGPDPDDKSGVNEGRRIIPMQGSWQIVNHQFYRECRSIDAVRKEQWRRRNMSRTSEDCPGQSGTVSESVPRSDQIRSDQIKNLSSPAEPAIDGITIVRRVFDAWRTIHHHPHAKLDAKRAARIRRALQHFTPQQLETALRGALKDNWLMGRDPKSPRKYDGLETLLRDNAQIERLIELERPTPSAKGRRPALRPGERWGDEITPEDIAGGFV